MLQIYVYDDTGARYELDLYKEEPLKLTLSVEDTKDLPRVNSAFSQSFRIPATQTNSKVFQWWYEVNTVDFDITRRVAADIYVDGLFYKSGHIRIQAAYVNDDTSQVDLEIVFFGETRDFASQIGEVTLNNLNLTALNHNLNLTNVQNSWDLNLVNGNVVYGLADRGYSYTDAGVNEQGSEIADTQQHNVSFQKSQHPLDISQFTPFIRVKAIIDAIFAQTEYSYSTDSFFNTSLFEDLYTDGLPDASPVIQTKEGFVDSLSTGQDFRFTVDVLFPNEIEDPSGIFNEQTSRLFIPSTEVYDISTTLDLRFARSILNTTVFYRVNIIRSTNGVETELATTGDLTTPAGIIPYNTTVNLSYDNGGAPIPQSTGPDDYIFVRIVTTSSNHEIKADSSFVVTPASVLNQFIAVPTLMKYDIKSIDFLKSILTKFKLIMVPNPDNEFEFIVKPWKDYIGSGDRLDWTEKLDLSKTVQLKPIFFEQSQVINFTDQPDEDMRNKPFQEIQGRTYGELQFDSQNDLLVDTKTIDTVFAPTPVDIVIGFDPASEFVIPYLAKEGTELADHGTLQILPIKPKPRLLFYNGKALQGTNEAWYYTDGTTTVHNTTDYPRFTPYSVFPTDATTINLNWFRETPYFAGPNDGKSVYEEYWNIYIQELYSKDARVMTAYFNLDSEDMRILSFDDLIFIKNAYWRILKVYDAPLSEIATVKVDLVKILQTLTFANGGTPTPSGGGIDEIIVTGGGGSPVEPPGDDTWGGNDNNYGDDDNTWGGTTYFYHTVENCVNPGDTFVARHSSLIAIGDSVQMSGVIHAGECYEVIAHTVAPEDTTVLAVFPDCFSCAQ